MGSVNDKKSKKPKFKPPTPIEVKTYLMAAQAKISIYRQRKVTSIKQRRMEIANCLKSGNIEVAKAKMETIIREEDIITVFDVLGPIIEILKEKVTFIMSSTDCPPELHT
ncbi:MAG: IST1 family protein [archaeon]|nr:IST1 family protein [archaeon]MCQ2816050.1 IST1 family protein [archaeon]